MGKKLTNEEFIERIKALYGDRFDYSKVEYINTKKPVCLVDKEFGNFDIWVRPDSLYKGTPITHYITSFEEFEYAINLRFPNKYDYSLAKEIIETTFKGKIISKDSSLKIPVLNKETGNVFYRTINSLFREDIVENMGLEGFLKEAKEIYGDTYDFSLVEWKGKMEPITVICPIHGEFITTPFKLINERKGCPFCGKENRRRTSGRLYTQDEVIEKFKEVHGDFYDYSKVVYKGMRTPVEIICPVHGSFWQTPVNHLRSGCPKCSGVARLDLDEFLRRSHLLYGDIYDYSLVKIDENTKAKDIITVICKKHGPFQVSIYNFLNQNSTCPKCREEAIQEKRNKDFKEFLEKSQEIHENRYDYSKVVWQNMATPVEIICPVHGSFMQIPSVHMAGANCDKCVREAAKMNREKFIEKSIEIYGTKYDYSKVEYIDMKTPVEIICPIHGSFWVKPADHLHANKGKGKGCPLCNESSGESKIRVWLEGNNIIYSKYKKYEGLIDKRSMNTDFYIESCNLAIEYQGQQHYIPVTYGVLSLEEANQALEDVKKHDKIKEEYFKNSDIDLLCIHYKDYKKIDEILEKVIIEKDYEYLKTTNSYIF